MRAIATPPEDCLEPPAVARRRWGKIAATGGAPAAAHASAREPERRL